MDNHSNAVKVGIIYKTNPQTVRRCKQKRENLTNLAGGTTPGNRRRPLKARFLRMES